VSADALRSSDAMARNRSDDGRDHREDDRLDLGRFGWAVTVLVVVLLVAAVAVALLVDPLVWGLAVVMVGVLVLWTRLVR
jgi:Flp pilus assembly protein TadB